jgi:hypothetical protein
MDNAEALRALETIERVMWRAELDSWEEEFSVIRNHLTDPGYVRVPVEPTAEMLNAAIDAHGDKLCDISRTGIRRSPQWMFAESYRAMLAAATKETNHD